MGVHFAMGGTGAIVAGFEKLLREEVFKSKRMLRLPRSLPNNEG